VFKVPGQQPAKSWMQIMWGEKGPHLMVSINYASVEYFLCA
jgi:hypothetical protein